MPAYHQMGYQTDNLLREPTLCDYAGAIISPVNYREEEITGDIKQLSGRVHFVFDPQLYYPSTNRGVLRTWSYFPADVDSSDRASPGWWDSLIEQIIATANRIGATLICSPAIVPRAFTDDYLGSVIEAGSRLAEKTDSNSTPVQTLPVNLTDLADRNRPFAIASIASATQCPMIYLILISDVEPRRELSDASELTGAMILISLLERAGLRVTVGFSSSDMILWKAAGATSCATGKFFNLRRFTKSRFEEPAKGGQQLPYWFEESLAAYLREADLIRIRKENLLSSATLSNPYYQEVFPVIDSGTGEAWLALSWRAYMCWFADMESRIVNGAVDVRTVLQAAENNWLLLEDREILLDEPRNNGSWVRPWRQAVADFRKALPPEQ